MNVTHSGADCQPTSTPIETRIDIPDQKGRISLDVFFVDERGVLIRSQRDRIQRRLPMIDITRGHAPLRGAAAPLANPQLEDSP